MADFVKGDLVRWGEDPDSGNTVAQLGNPSSIVRYGLVVKPELKASGYLYLVALNDQGRMKKLWHSDVIVERPA